MSEMVRRTFSECYVSIMRELTAANQLDKKNVLVILPFRRLSVGMSTRTIVLIDLMTLDFLRNAKFMCPKRRVAAPIIFGGRKS